MKSPVKLFLAVLILAAALVLAPELVAQPPPPALPSVPDQAPIDGGLGLLAAAGSYMAWRKLRKK